MHFEDLPEEVIIIIIRILDQKSVVQLFYTCKLLRNIISSYASMKKLKLSMNTHATAKFLKSEFVLRMANRFLELDMSGVPDITKSLIIPVLKKFKSLVKLNVSFTRINIMDFVDIYNSCPTIKDIAINFIFTKSNLSCEDNINKLKNIFKGLDKVHFVACTDQLKTSKLVPFILEKAELKVFTLSLCWVNHMVDYSMNETYVTNWQSLNERKNTNWQSLNAERINIFLPNWKSHRNYTNYDALECTLFDHLLEHEFIVISVLDLSNIKVLVSPVFSDKIKLSSKHKVVVKSVIKNINVDENAAIFFWKKSFKGFDENFFDSLSKELQGYFPVCIDLARSYKEHDWFYAETSVRKNNSEEENSLEPSFKRKRKACETFCINFDSELEEKKNVKLNILFDVYYYNVGLSPSCEYLRKLTFLSLTGASKYNVEFFNVLFRCCTNLETLNVEAPYNSPCAFPISRSIPLSCSLKNLRLLDKCIDFETLFSALSQCRSLENIHVYDESREPSQVANPVLLFERCENLYCFSIRASISESSRVRTLKLFNEVKNSCGKPYIHVELLSNIRERLRNNMLILFDPFISVFKLFPVKPFELGR